MPKTACQADVTYIISGRTNMAVKTMHKRIRIAVLVMGYSGLVTEVLLLRELMIVFAGIELSIGIILANWLILEAAGCLTLGRIADKTRFRLETYTIIAVLFSAAFIAAIFFTRILKDGLAASWAAYFFFRLWA